jgi:hypothetical protein
MTTPDSGGPLDPLDEPTPNLLHLTDEEHAAGLRRIEALGRQDRNAKTARVLSALRSSADLAWAERNAAEARADKLRRENGRLSSRCYLLAGLAVVGWGLLWAVSEVVP